MFELMTWTGCLIFLGLIVGTLWPFGPPARYEQWKYPRPRSHPPVAPLTGKARKMPASLKKKLQKIDTEIVERATTRRKKP